jgi:hypothetical protein
MPDGSKAHFTMQMMDHAAGFSHTFADGSVDHTHWSRPGFRFADTNDAARIKANDAYEQRRQAMHYDAKRRRKQEEEDEEEERRKRAAGAETEMERRQRLARKAAQAVTGDARALADAAWEARNERLRNGWRNNR